MAGRRQMEHERRRKSLLLLADGGFADSEGRGRAAAALRAELAAERARGDRPQDALDASRRVAEEARQALRDLQADRRAGPGPAGESPAPPAPAAARRRRPGTRWAG